MLTSKHIKFRFIDLFAGIGGIRTAFERSGGDCVFSSEWDKYSRKTYEAFFGEIPAGDITKINPVEIPDHEIPTGGFPCQPFSLAGVSAKNSLGRPHGFEDKSQGTLFFNIKEIIKVKNPKAFLLENVKNLRSHDKGRTFEVIKKILTEELGYDIFYKVIDSSGWVPQHRERIYIVGFQKSLGIESFIFPDAPKQRIPELGDMLVKNVDSRYILGQGTWDSLVRHKEHHENLGHGFGYGLIEAPFNGKITRTLSARYHKDGSEILIAREEGNRPRRLTPLECFRLQGFPKELERFFDGTEPQPVSDTQAYRQFGNSVSVPVVTAIAKNIATTISK